MVQIDFSFVQRVCGVRVRGCFSFESVSFDLLAGVVSIHGVPDVSCEFRFRFEMVVVGTGRFS